MLNLHPGKVKSADLETENGTQKYSRDIQTKEGIREVGVDANTGKVVEDTIESGADGRRRVRGGLVIKTSSLNREVRWC